MVTFFCISETGFLKEAVMLVWHQIKGQYPKYGPTSPPSSRIVGKSIKYSTSLLQADCNTVLTPPPFKNCVKVPTALYSAQKCVKARIHPPWLGISSTISPGVQEISSTKVNRAFAKRGLVLQKCMIQQTSFLNSMFICQNIFLSCFHLDFKLLGLYHCVFVNKVKDI